MSRDWFVVRDPVRSRVVATLNLLLAGPLVIGWAIAILGRESVFGGLTPAVWAVELVVFWLVMWWCTDRALREFDAAAHRVDELITAGVRWGGVAGVLFAWTNVLVLILLGTVGVFVGPQPDEYALVGAQWAYLWIGVGLATVGALLAGMIGAGLGGVIGIIDHAVLTAAHWTLRLPRNR